MRQLFLIALMALGLLLKSQDSISVHYDFSDNSLGLSETDNDKAFSKVQDGRFVYENKIAGNWRWTGHTVFIDPNKDYDIETGLTLVEGKEDAGYGLLLKMKDEKTLVFLISGNKKYTVFIYDGKNFNTLAAWTDAPSLINGVRIANKMTIAVKAASVAFLVNDKEVFKYNQSLKFTNLVGFYLGDKFRVEYDYLTVRQNIPRHINLVKNLKAGVIRTNLGSNVNSLYDEIMPLIAPDAKRLYFNRKKHPENLGDDKRDDIWFSDLQNDGEWSKAVNMGPPLNNSGYNFVIAITPDNNTMLLGNTYNADGTQKGTGFSLSQRTENGWTLPSDVKVKNYYNDHGNTSSFYANNGKALIMSVERKDSYGGSDLYVSFPEADGSWTEPLNLGPQVNSFGSDITPFLASDGITLYYSTNGKRGYGSNDIFMTRRLDSTWTRWSEPENLGPEINTSDWDAYFTLPASGKYAYISSSKNALGMLDIFRLELPEAMRPNPVVLVYGKVLNSKTKAPIGTSIEYADLQSGKQAGVASSSPADGSYKIILPAGKIYSFLASKKDFVSVSDHVDLKNLKEYKEIERDLYLAPIEEGQTIRLNNIFFDFAKAELLPASFADIDRLVKVLNEYPNMKIEVAGHTDNVGSDDANLKLSAARSQAVVAYLVKQDIAKERLVARGYGETRPVDSNDSDSGRAMNRRVEFTILKKN